MNAPEISPQNRETLLHRILTPLGERVGIDARYFASNAFILTINYGVSVLSGLVTGYLVARILPANMYGSYRLVGAAAGLLSLITLPDLSTALARDVARRGEQSPVRFTMLWNAITSIPGVIALFGAVLLLPLWHQEDQWLLFIVAGLLFLPINIGNSFFDGIIAGTANFRRALQARILSTSITIVMVLTTLWLLPSPAILYGLAAGVTPLVCLWMLRPMLKKFPSKEKSWSILRYAAFLSINSIPFTMAWYLDSFLVSAFFGLKQLALFQVAIMIPEQVKVWYKFVLPVSFRRQAVGDDSRERRRKLILIVALGTVIMAIGIAAYIWLAPWFMSFLFPNYELKSLVLLTRIIAISLLSMPSQLFDQYLKSQGFIREQRYVQWTTTAIYVCSLLFLIPHYGPLGAALARAIYRLTSACLCFLAIRFAPIRHENA